MRSKVGAAALACALLLAICGPATAAGDAAAGEKTFKQKCGACHNATEEKNKVGPYLKGVYNRKAGEVAGFNYSDAMKNSGIVWDQSNLAAYLKEPKGFIAGNKMAFVGLKDEGQIANVIAYLEQVSAQ